MGTNGLPDSFKQTIIHTIVGEFQDSNYLQDAFWVQTIVGTRLDLIGGRWPIHLFLPRRRPELWMSIRKYKVYNLSTNHRSLQEILDIGWIEWLPLTQKGNQVEKPMKAHRTTEGPEAVKWYETADDSQEAEHVLITIKALVWARWNCLWRHVLFLIRSQVQPLILKCKASAVKFQSMIQRNSQTLWNLKSWLTWWTSWKSWQTLRTFMPYGNLRPTKTKELRQHSKTWRKCGKTRTILGRIYLVG